MIPKNRKIKQNKMEVKKQRKKQQTIIMKNNHNNTDK